MDELRLRAAGITTLFAAAKPTYFAELASAGIVVAVLWGPISAAALLAWFGLLLGVTLARLALHWGFFRAPVEPVHAPSWKRRFVLGALVSGAVWALAVSVFFPDYDPLRQMALVFVACGHLIAAAGLYGASRRAFYAFSALPFVAIVIQLLGEASETYQLMALVVGVFGVVMWKVHLDTYRNILANLRAEGANEDLLARLRTTEEQLRDAIDSFPEGVAVWNADGRLAVCNDTYRSALGSGDGSRSGEAPAQFQSADGRWWRVSSRPMRGGGHVDAVSDISDFKRRVAAEQALTASEAMYRNLVETSSELIWSLDLDGCWTYLNAAGAHRIYGREASEMIGRPQEQVVARELKEREGAVLRRILAGGSVFEHETRHVRADGSPVDLSFNAIPLRDLAGGIVGATGTARDVTERKRAAAALHESVEKLRLAVQAADLRYWEWEAGRDGPELPEAAGGDLVHAEDRERCASAWSAATARGEPYEVEYRASSADGELLWFSSRGVPVLDAAGNTYRMIGVSQDITARKRREEAVRFLAYHDALTGLPNRRLLDDRLKQALYAAQRRSRKVAAMLIDLDGFKRVNDSLGHRAGDAVLREVANRLASCVRKADTLARHGGDEFVVVLSDVQADSDCQAVADKVLHALEKDFRIEGDALHIGASIGISVYPEEASDGDTLLRNADAAMYRAKQLGRNQYSFYGR